MGSLHLRSGRAALRIGRPIPTTGLKLSDREALTRELYSEISAMLERV
jgi:hypothetical protein